MFEDIAATRALILSFLAGMSTLLGAFIIFLTNKKSEKLVTISLGFAGGVMISVSFTDLMPNANILLAAYAGEKIGVVLGVIFLLIGVLLAALLDKFVPHEDEPHGDGKQHENLFRVGFVSTLAIGLHNFPEGISVAMPIYFATGSKMRAFKYTFLSGIAEPIGATLAFLILKPYINDLTLGMIFGIISGVMLYIAIEELLPSSRQYGYTKEALIATFAGIILMPLTHVI